MAEPGTGTNQRGRDAVHFHRNGVADSGGPSRVNGSVVVDSRGWGYFNHSSFVEFTDNVAYSSSAGAATRFHKLGNSHDQRSVIEDLKLGPISSRSPAK